MASWCGGSVAEPISLHTSCMKRCGVVWYGEFGVVWCGEFGVVCCGVVWCGDCGCRGDGDYDDNNKCKFIFFLLSFLFPSFFFFLSSFFSPSSLHTSFL